MSCLSFQKKLLPVKRTWTTFTRSLHFKLTKIKDSKLIRTTTHHLLSLRFLSRLFIPFKRRSLTKSSDFRHFQPHRYQHYSKNCSPVYIDGLFDGDQPSHPWNSAQKPVYNEKGETSKAKEEVREKTEQVGNQGRAGNVGYDVDQVWRRIIASSPQLHCVDDRAEDFISKFKEDMRLQRERSILEFQEMLKRSA